MKLVVEQCTQIGIAALQKEIRRIIRRDDPTADEQSVYNYTEAELKKFIINGQEFKYDFTKNPLGGYRWFFVCQKCNERALKLFLPPTHDLDHEHIYLCKRCHHLANESIMKTRNSMFQKVLKPLKRLKEIEAKLEKGHLSSQKVEELLNEYDKLEAEMKSCPEHRYYVFKKKRGMNLL